MTELQAELQAQKSQVHELRGLTPIVRCCISFCQYQSDLSDCLPTLNIYRVVLVIIFLLEALVCGSTRLSFSFSLCLDVEAALLAADTKSNEKTDQSSMLALIF